MASDSRISWGSEWARWDAGRKLFACRSYADMFGYAGDVVFPCLVLGQIAEAIDSQLLFHANDISESRHAKFVSAVQASFDRRHNVPDTDFILLHGSRQSSGRKAEYKLWSLSYNAAHQKWLDSQINVPTDRSSLLIALGSGEKSVTTHQLRWETTSQGGTSRAIFGAFCDSIRSGSDPLSGGVPQLIGVYHTRMPQVFGIIYDGRPYLHGLPLPRELETSAVEWRDELFQRIDSTTLTLLPGAQRHIRPIT